MSDGKCIVKYLRLSLEDEDMLDESNSITNQRIVIGQYIASKNEFKNTEVLEFKDDGYSGTNFDRPGIPKYDGISKRWKSQHNYSERPFSIRQESYRG